MRTKLLALLATAVLITLMAFTENEHIVDSLNVELSHAKREIRQLHFKTEIAARMDDRDSAVRLLESVLNRSIEINQPQLQLDANKTLASIYLSMQDLN